MILNFISMSVSELLIWTSGKVWSRMKKHFLRRAARGQQLKVALFKWVSQSLSCRVPRGSVKYWDRSPGCLLALLSENDTTQGELKCNAKVFFLGHAAWLLMICHIKSCRGKTYGNNLKYNRKGKKRKIIKLCHRIWITNTILFIYFVSVERRHFK